MALLITWYLAISRQNRQQPNAPQRLHNEGTGKDHSRKKVLKPMKRIKNDLTGKRFGRWVVVGLSEKSARVKWLCVCDCGAQKEVLAFSLTSGDSKSCGCFNKQRTSEYHTTHGLSKTPTYRIWHGMKQRCLNPNCNGYHNYGGRGITVCASWKNSFENFLDDMGERPFLGAELDRINNNGNYEKSNCRWVSKKQNANNRRSNRPVMRSDGKIYKTIKAAAADVCGRPEAISRVCSGQAMTHRGYGFEYL